MQSLAFPMELKENGLLCRTDKAASVIALLQMMARTPSGSWAACPVFGLRDLFENGRNRADIAAIAATRINDAFDELGVSEFHVLEVTRELSPGRDVDTYMITLQSTASEETFTTHVDYEL